MSSRSKWEDEMAKPARPRRVHKPQKPDPEMTGTGAARDAARKLKGRKRQIDDAVERMSQ